MHPYNVLFLCTGNSARSIMAEAILHHLGKPHFRAFSAGSKPTGVVHPAALKQIQLAGLPVKGLRSKSWEEFTGANAPKMNFVFTVCDGAAKETSPLWPGQPMSAHWGIPAPAAIEGNTTKIEQAFQEAFSTFERRIRLFLDLPIPNLDPMTIQHEIRAIGHQ